MFKNISVPLLNVIVNKSFWLKIDRILQKNWTILLKKIIFFFWKNDCERIYLKYLIWNFRVIQFIKTVFIRKYCTEWSLTFHSCWECCAFELHANCKDEPSAQPLFSIVRYIRHLSHQTPLIVPTTCIRAPVISTNCFFSFRHKCLHSMFNLSSSMYQRN